jgi:catechol 2,3-dioxygenase-like lactoylglutathione lyase family enzyme
VGGVVITLAAVSFACADVDAMTAFWCGIVPDAPLRFRAAAKTRTIEAPIHLDVNTPDPDADIERALALGARLVARKHEQRGPIDEAWTVLRDPEGNGFCIQGPDRRRERAYLGNVTFACVDPPALGRFWREALGYRETELPEELKQQILDAGVDPAEFGAFADAVDPEGGRPRLLFQRREKTPAPEPALRLELAADDVEAEAARLVALGATRAGGLPRPRRERVRGRRGVRRK